jgi:ubiquinone/menaquinone biosynthesis C-methylase UbiE
MHNSPAHNTDFNDTKHARGDWNTTVIATRNPIVRSIICYMSAKRSGVDSLALITRQSELVLDAGCGNGAYSVWFASRKTARIISVDVSYVALQSVMLHSQEKTNKSTLCPVCADLQYLPFKENCFTKVFSIDVLGHVKSVSKVLNELARCTKTNARLFVHSECADYKNHWPDKSLINILKQDIPAQGDGHTGSMCANDLFMHYARRFRVLSTSNPRGFFGWLLGYPEKYYPAFVKAGWKKRAVILRVFRGIKKMPILGLFIRFKNATTNHVENYFGIKGGGSCFAELEKYQDHGNR